MIAFRHFPGGRHTPSGAYAPDVDETIDSIENTFDDHGRLWKVTSYGSSTAKNGVLFAYNDFDQVVNEYQNHSGAATTSDPDVVYSYEDAGSGSNSIRFESTTYPDNTARSRGTTARAEASTIFWDE